MITLQLTYDEAALLHTMVEDYLGDLRVEINHTQKLDYRETLKKQEVLVRKLLHDLEMGNVQIVA